MLARILFCLVQMLAKVRVQPLKRGSIGATSGCMQDLSGCTRDLPDCM